MRRQQIVDQKSKLHVLTRHYPPDQEMLEFVNSIPRDKPDAAVPASSSGVQAKPSGAAVAGGR